MLLRVSGDRTDDDYNLDGILGRGEVGVPNEEWGEEVRSVIQLQPELTPSDALSEELITWARDRLAAFKCPRKIDYVDELPRSAAGKIQRKVVRAPYWED